ncbi:RagB/SusD family nutrient uptake outer membrane protein [Parabacteroides sp. Marseille-P3160]|uniref:RagB/SusD family nutrient uptake outer membrane protein n=1 Tax=Parabacteroides sp. Marseille-P3160 TaxID=1917887 RepID=UPI0009BB38A0|nr:RagB/SusD family nutrient uptake outer membrane protein [Parabacteroides sp. Marseille-P3160]
MKRIIYIILFSGILCLSCEDFLDRAPESGLTTEKVFSKYENFRLFFDAVYNGTSKDDPTNESWYEYNIKTSYSLYLTVSDFRSTWEALTETADMGRINRQPIKYGQIEANLQWFTTHRVAPILHSMFKDIRICNVALQNIHMLADADEETINDFKGQAHFVRAYCHFSLMKLWGGMPYIDYVIGSDDEWDIPRLSNNETLNKIAADLDTAAYYFGLAGKMRRDPGPGKTGHLNDPEQWRPNGVASKALKGRALLYAASPLSNVNGTKDWEDAAIACWEAIKIAEQYEYALLPTAEYKKNFVGVKYTNEQIWAWNYGDKAINYTDKIQTQLLNNAMRNNATSPTPECPTQNMVDRYETIWGDPLFTANERVEAVAKGNYKYQNPYANRDPRFYINVLYNTAPVPGFGTAKIYWENVDGKTVYSEMLNPSHTGITQTGYYQAKYWGGQSVKNNISTYYTDPLIRLAELYLNYGEAANEAYGPNGRAPGATMSALEAVNTIRERIGMVPVQARFTSSIESFRERIKNERTVELYGEGHHFFDIRRWKDAPKLMNEPSRRMDIEKVPVSEEYPTGYKYDDSQVLPATRQVRWTSDAMYYFPFPIVEENKMKNFAPNQRW